MEKLLVKQINQYVDIITEIRKLSSLSSKDITDADDYGRKLRENFGKISELAEKSRLIVSETILPILRKTDSLFGYEVEAFYLLCEKLLDPYSEEELDLEILDKTARRLLTDAKSKKNDDDIIHAMYVYINACYANVVRTNRIRVEAKLSMQYRDAGVAVAREMMEYLKEEAFSSISEKSRHYVLIHSRFYLALFDTFYVEEEINEERLSGLWKSFDLSEKTFYRDLTPNYDWNYHRIRCLENMGQLTERGNAWCFDRRQLQRIYYGVRMLEKIWQENPQENDKILPKVQLDLVCLRNAFFAGKLLQEEYEDGLIERYIKSSNDSFDSYSLIGNIMIPVELLTVLDRTTISEEKTAFIEKMYAQLVDYIQHSTNTESFYFLLDYLTGFLEAFVELPGCITFEEMTLSCLAAMHPPTYVHSLQVAQISRCLGRHLYTKNPALFGGREHALDVLYRGALCHDFGKLAMLDTIFVYGRSLSDTEFSVIREHPAMGAYLLQRNASSRMLAPIVAGHHIWHDKKGGYSLQSIVSPENQIYVDIISIADSIDAATDVIGRNYRKEKKLDEILDEIYSLDNDRYSSEVVNILKETSVLEDLSFLINKGREFNYRSTFLLLSNAENKE